MTSFSYLKTGNFSLEDEPREGCSKGLDSEDLEASVAVNPAAKDRELGEKSSDLRVVGKLSPQDQRVIGCDSLFTRQLQVHFLNRFITGDEKWTVYHNVKHRRQWISQGTRLLGGELNQNKICSNV